VEILSNPVFRGLQGKRLYKEQKFLVSLPIADTYARKEGADSELLSKSQEEIIFQGAIDLLAIGEDNEVQIVDYKFSRGGAEYLKKHYAPQLDLYRRAVSKIMRIPLEKIRCSIVNIYHGFQVDFDF
jgi:ATP-dependent exoDNAse (exonuclease V) beta subunit